MLVALREDPGKKWSVGMMDSQPANAPQSITPTLHFSKLSTPTAAGILPARAYSIQKSTPQEEQCAFFH